MAIDDPLNLETMDSLPQLLGRDVIFSVATRSAVESRLKEFYRDMTLPDAGSDIDGEDGGRPPSSAWYSRCWVDAFGCAPPTSTLNPWKTGSASATAWTASWWK